MTISSGMSLDVGCSDLDGFPRVTTSKDGEAESIMNEPEHQSTTLLSHSASLEELSQNSSENRLVNGETQGDQKVPFEIEDNDDDNDDASSKISSSSYDSDYNCVSEIPPLEEGVVAEDSTPEGHNPCVEAVDEEQQNSEDEEFTGTPVDCSSDEVKGIENLTVQSNSEAESVEPKDFPFFPGSQISDKDKSIHELLLPPHGEFQVDHSSDSRIKNTQSYENCSDQRTELWSTSLTPNYESDDFLIEMKERELLHNRTLGNDYHIFMLQQKWRSYCLANQKLPSFPVPSPLKYDPHSSETLPRCQCPQCSSNEIALKTNYEMISEFAKPSNFHHDIQRCNGYPQEELEVVDKTNSDTPKPEISLPLKKRKTYNVSYNPPMKEEKVLDISYPSTPMISIASLEMLATSPLGVIRYKHNVSHPKVTATLPHPTIKPTPPVAQLVNCVEQQVMYCNSFNSVRPAHALQPLHFPNSPHKHIQAAFPDRFAQILQTQNMVEHRKRFKTAAQLKETPFPP